MKVLGWSVIAWAILSYLIGAFIAWEASDAADRAAYAAGAYAYAVAARAAYAASADAYAVAAGAAYADMWAKQNAKLEQMIMEKLAEEGSDNG